MIKQSRKLLLIVGASMLAPFAAEFGVTSFSAAAAEEKESEVPEETRRVPSMSQSTFKKLSEVQELMDLKDFRGSIALLNEMLTPQKMKRLNGNEKGQVYNMRGFAYFSLEDYSSAIRDFEQVLAQGEDIPEGLETTTLYTLAQLSYVDGQYQKALDYMETWVEKANNPGPEPHIFMGQVYYTMKNFPSAIDQIEQGIAKAEERGTQQKEQWWGLLNYLYYEEEEWDLVLSSLEVMIKRWPKRSYWIRLAGVHGQLNHDKEQVYAMEAAHVANMLEREGDYLALAGLLMQEQAPLRAARALSAAVDAGIVEGTARNLQSLGQAFQLAQETAEAIDAFEAAAKLSDDGKIYERLAHLYLDDDEYDKCVTAANGAINKGGLRRVQSTYIVKGMCLYNKDRLTTARQSFVSCRNESRRVKDDSNQRICNQWIVYIDREKQRRAQLESAI